jgi:hypothetical protein
MKMRLVAIIAMSAGACANDPQYVACGSSDTMDVCVLDTQNGSNVGSGRNTTFAVTGSLHVPVMPPDSDLQKATAALQKTMPTGVMVPTYRLDMYDLSVEWSLKNLDDKPTSARVALNAANEDYAWQPSLIMPASDESPPPPSLQGDIPMDVPANAEIQGEFTEDDLLEAAVDLDMITRGNINMYAATLTVNKDDQSFQPLSAAQPPPPGSNQPPAQTPMGSAVPRAAFRQIVRVDMSLLPDDPTVHLTLSFDVRIRVHTNNVIDDKGMNAPTGQLMIIDPPAFVPAYTP